MELFGTEAGAKLNPLTVYRTQDDQTHDLTPEPEEKMGSWDRIANHFIECILDGTPCEAPLRHGLTVQKMMEAILKSSEIGEAVSID